MLRVFLPAGWWSHDRRNPERGRTPPTEVLGLASNLQEDELNAKLFNLYVHTLVLHCARGREQATGSV
jgi:hypothetical protein